MRDVLSPAADSARRWLQVRRVLNDNRRELTRLAAGLYPGVPRVGSTDLLCRDEWIPAEPAGLDAVPLSWAAGAPAPVADGRGPASEHVRPRKAAGGRYESYSAAIAGLDPPAIFEDRACYRILSARLAGPRGKPRPEGQPGQDRPAGMRFTGCGYFDGVDLGHAAAHELAAAWHGRPAGVTMAGLPLRASAGDPCELARRCAICAVTTLTLRRTARGEASFVLHWRDPARVNHAGGLYQVLPAGIFQPVAGTPAAVENDFSLWRCMTREFSEELLGTSEDYDAPGGVLGYDRWPFYERLTGARRAGRLAVYCLGVGVDPLTLATDILTVAVFDADLFDEAFGGLVAMNAEGRVITGGDGAAGIPFTAGTVGRLSGDGEPVQAAGAGLLQLAWRHRRHLLG